MEQTDVIVENIHWALFEDAEVAEVKRPRNSKPRKFYYEKWLKLDDFEILASVTSKMTSKPQQPRRPPIGFWFKWYFRNQWFPLIEMSYRLHYSENFHFSNFQHPASEAAQARCDCPPNVALSMCFNYLVLMTFSAMQVSNPPEIWQAHSQYPTHSRVLLEKPLV